MEVLAGPAGALLEGLHNPKALVGPAVELQVGLEFADYSVTATLRRAFGYHRPIVVADPQRDRPFGALLVGTAEVGVLQVGPEQGGSDQDSIA